MKNPCHNCHDRTPTCHSDCEAYLKFFRFRREENKKRQDAKRIEYDTSFKYKRR